MADGLQLRAQNISRSLLGAIQDLTAIPEMPVNITQLQTSVIDEAPRLTQPMQSLGAPSTGIFNTDAINADVASAVEQLDRSTSPVFEIPQRPDLPEKKSGGLLSGLKNFVSDPAAMAQMAIAFNSMRFKPDQGLAQSMQNVIERQGLIRSGNATVQALRNVGTELASKYADAIAANPTEAANLYKSYLQEVNKGKDIPSKVQEYEYAVSQGYEGSYMEFLNLTADRTSFSYTAGPQIGTIPQGFQLVSNEDGTYRLDPIPGGPEDIKQQQTEEDRVRVRELAETSGNVVFEDIRRYKDLVLNQGVFTPVTGITGAIASKIPGSARVDAEELALTIKASIGFDRLQQMREASPTGGALGQVSDRELATLQAVLGSLSAAQSDEQLLRNLDRLEEVYAEILYKLQAYPNASEYGFGASIQTQDDPLGIL
jgi:hypothetical protein